jgi:hypothetical protein
MADPACSNDSAALIGAATTSLTEDVYDPAGTTASGIDLTPYINYKELLEETGVSTSLISIGCGMGDVGVSTKTVWVSSTAT